MTTQKINLNIYSADEIHMLVTMDTENDLPIVIRHLDGDLSIFTTTESFVTFIQEIFKENEVYQDVQVITESVKSVIGNPAYHSRPTTFEECMEYLSDCCDNLTLI